MPSDPIETTARRRAALCLWLANLAAGIAVGTAYLAHVPEDSAPRTFVFAGLGLVSSVTTLALVPGFAYALLLRFVRGARVLGLSQAVVGAAFLVALKADTIVYSLLGYHVNSAVWNVMLTRGSEDAVALGGEVWWPVALMLVLLSAGEYGLWQAVRRRSIARRAAGRGRLRLRPVALCAFVLLAVTSVEKTIYAAADLEGDRQVHEVSQVLPLYQGLRVSELLPEGLESARGALPAIEFAEKERALDYPHRRPTIASDGPRPNVLLLVLDSWRRDMLSPETTPRLWQRTAAARRYENHWSAGNGTRFGVFSMLYGLHGSYWFSVLAERRAPVLLESLGELGYDRSVFSSASQSFPEFRETAWSGMQSDVRDDFPSETSDARDAEVAAAFASWIAQRGAASPRRPFFSFVLLDAPHQPYNSPPGGPFQPAAEELNYIELARSNAPELVERVFNRYRNAVHYADRVAGEILDALEAAGELENTLVVVTGDHGEEFQETGFWGHTSNFTHWQLAVPLFLSGPGVQPGTEARATSHLDLPATILELLGADPRMRADWTLGGNLLELGEARPTIAAGWDHLGMLTADGIFRIRMGSASPLDVDVFDASWRLAPDPAGAYLRQVGELERLAAECRRFLAAPSDAGGARGARAFGL